MNGAVANVLTIAVGVVGSSGSGVPVLLTAVFSAVRLPVAVSAKVGSSVVAVAVAKRLIVAATQGTLWQSVSPSDAPDNLRTCAELCC